MMSFRKLLHCLICHRNFPVRADTQTWFHLLGCCLIINRIICHHIDLNVRQFLFHDSENPVIVCDHPVYGYRRITQIICPDIDKKTGRFQIQNADIYIFKQFVCDKTADSTVIDRDIQMVFVNKFFDRKHLHQ